MKSEGKLWDEIAAVFRNDYGELITSETLRKYVGAHRTVNRKGAEIPAGLIEPKGGFAPHVRMPPPKVQHPQGWEPYVETKGDEATAVSQPMEDASPDEATLIEGWKLDPKEWRIVKNSLQCRRWQAVVPVREPVTTADENGEKKTYYTTSGYEEKWLYYYKATLTKRDPTQKQADVTELVAEIKRYKPSKPAQTGDVALAVCIADLQCGKDDGDGTGGIVRRFLDAMEAVKVRAMNLRKMGVAIGPLYVFGLGDLVEGCDSSWYPQQTFRAQLDRREQVKVARRLVLRAIREWAPLFEKVIVGAIPGNHGENRKDGASFSTFGDNDDIAIFEMVEEVLSENPAAFGHVHFKTPKDELTLTLDVCGTVTTLAHGHQFKNGGAAAKKAEDWWKGQAIGFQPSGDAKLLLSGHLHHLVVNSIGSRTHIQAPALEGGSDWFRHLSGQDAAKGVLTLCIGKNLGPEVKDGEHVGWDYLQVV